MGKKYIFIINLLTPIGANDHLLVHKKIKTIMDIIVSSFKC
jgi:hypothetical protein